MSADKFVDPRVEPCDSTSPTGGLVKLLIGQNEDSLYVHESVLVKSSEFFTSAMKKQWLKGGEQPVIELPNDNLDVVTTYTQYLYSGNIVCNMQNSSHDDKLKQYVHLARLYAFGEEYLDSTFQNKVIDAIVATARDKINFKSFHPVGEAVNIIYEGTPKGSPARRMLVNIWYDRAQAHWMTDYGTSKLHHEFLEELMLVILEKRQRPTKVSECLSKGVFEGIPSAYYKKDKTTPSESSEGKGGE